MPYFSFSLKKNFLKKANLQLDNVNNLLDNKVYYSKSTFLWKYLNKNKNNEHINFFKFEKRKKIKKLGNSVLFCLPPSIGLGDSIEYALAIKAINNAKKFKSIAVGFVGRFSYIFEKYFELNNLYSNFIEESEYSKFETIFHFSLEIPNLKLQKYNRSDIESSITSFFNVKKYRKKKLFKKKQIKKISLFPISQSPIRSMSIEVVNQIIKKFEKKFEIEIFLDKQSIISNYIENKLINNKIKKIYPYAIEDLSKQIENIDYGIFVDSGPLHLAKILNKKGLLIITSVHSKYLLSDFNTIKVMNNNYKSQYCTAPCGLTNLINYKNKVGCYDSLKINFKNIIKLNQYQSLQRGDLKDKYIDFTINPVGCIEKIDIKELNKILMNELITP